MNNKKTAWLFLIAITTIIGISASVLSFVELTVLSILLGGLGAIIYRKFFSSKNT